MARASATGELPVSGEGPRVKHRLVTQGYFRTLGVPVLHGRDFQAADARAGAAIINETMAEQFWPDQDPLGKTVLIEGQPRPAWLRVIGVVRTGDDNSAYRPRPRPEVVEFSPVPGDSTWFMVRTKTDPFSLVPDLRRAAFAIDKDQPLAAVRTLDAWIDHELSGSRSVTGLLAAFAVAALSLALIGVYGTLAYFIAQQRHELGVRLALGARRGHIICLVAGRATRLALAGALLGLVAAFGLARLMMGTLVGVTELDPAIFAASAVLLLFAAALAAFGPARRAANLDAVTALRHE